MDVKLAQLIKRIENFRDERNWKQFHNPKDEAISLSLEASELLEHFQWKNESEIKDYVNANKSKIADELMDVLYWVILMSSDLKLNVAKEFERKMKKNEAKYPIERAKNTHKKYTELK